MSQRTVIAILGMLCVALLAYFVLTTYLSGAKPAGEWERATEVYVQEYHRWLSSSPASGWARVQALATGQERDRIEKLRPARQEPTGWQFGGGAYHLLAQFGERALVQASYTLERGQEKTPIEEVYLLGNTVKGIKVVQLLAGRCDQ